MIGAPGHSIGVVIMRSILIAAIIFTAFPARADFFGGGSPGLSITGAACSATGQTVIYNGTSWFCSNPTMPITTVGSLGTCGTAQKGQQLLVTDALAPTFLAIMVGGGAVVVGALCNGTSWIVR